MEKGTLNEHGAPKGGGYLGARCDRADSEVDGGGGLNMSKSLESIIIVVRYRGEKRKFKLPEPLPSAHPSSSLSLETGERNEKV